MTKENSNNKLILINTVYLYIRMFISLGLSLYTSRLLLDALGVEDYGIFNVVGGIVTMFSFLNNTLAGATSRFINYQIEISKENVQKVFSTALSIHIIIALTVLLIGETVGLWFLNNKLVIPSERMYTANWLLQFSLITMLFNFTQVPYNASIIAYERMKIYAYLGLADSIFKLLIVYGISFSNYDKLILYGALIMIEQIIITLLYRVYCTRSFKTCKFILSLRNEYLRPMLMYSIWDIFGQGSLIAKTQGINILMNIFFGTVINAANGIATQVQTALLQFSNNITTAFRPQIVKNCATKNIKKMEQLINMGAIVTFLMMLLIVMPIIIYMDLLLGIWLKEVPDYSVIFCQISLIMSIYSMFSNYPMIGIDATGLIKDTSIILCILYVAIIPFSYISFKIFDGQPYIPYIYNACLPFITVFINSIFLHKYLPEFSWKKYISNTVIKGYIIFFIDLSLLLYIKDYLPNNIMGVFILYIIGAIIVCTLGSIICLNSAQRTIVFDFIRTKFKK